MHHGRFLYTPAAIRNASELIAAPVLLLRVRAITSVCTVLQRGRGGRRCCRLSLSLVPPPRSEVSAVGVVEGEGGGLASPPQEITPSPRTQRGTEGGAPLT